MTELPIGEEESALLVHFRHAVAEDLRELAILQEGELTHALLQEIKELDFPQNLGLKLQKDHGKEAWVFMHKAITEIPVPIEKAILDKLATDFAAIYLNNTLRASPYESVWLTEDGLTRQAPMFQTRAWYEKYGLMAADWKTRPDDHLVLQLHFVSHLFKLDDKKETLQEASRFLDEHLLRWITDFAGRVANRCETTFYAGIVILTAQYLDELRDMLAQILEEPRPSPEAIEQRMKTPPDPSEVNFCSPRFDDSPDVGN